MEEQGSILKNDSLPSCSSKKQHNEVSFAFTDPCIQSRNKYHLQAIAKKINSKDMFSTFPTRLDPNIQFSDDEEDEEISTLKEVKMLTTNKENNLQQEYEKQIPSQIMKTPELTLISRVKSVHQEFSRNGVDNEPNVHRLKYKPFNPFLSSSKLLTQRDILKNKQNFRPQSESKIKKYHKDISLEFPRGNLNALFQPSLPIEKPVKNVDASSDNIIEINGKSYNILSLLGSGGSCKVYSAFDLETKLVVAIKRVELLPDTDAAIREGYEKEIEYLCKLQNSNRVIEMYDFEYRDNEILLILEHGDIDFAKYISNEAKLKRLTPLMIKFYWTQMLEAVADIHKYGIVHSDLKPANFLLVAGNLKLIDFGIATSVPDDKTSTLRDTQVGTLNYISPEAITQLSTSDEKQPCFKVGVKSDVWSLGCILYNLVYGMTPFGNIRNRIQKIYAITNPKYEISFKPLSDHLLLDVLKSCLQRNPRERVSVEELRKHPYLTEDNFPSASAIPSKSNDDLSNVVKQMQFLTPKRMSYISKVVKELSENTDV